MGQRGVMGGVGGDLNWQRDKKVREKQHNFSGEVFATITEAT